MSNIETLACGARAGSAWRSRRKTEPAYDVFSFLTSPSIV
jgi:hypothetical protein